jgi:hypothetical protein
VSNPTHSLLAALVSTTVVVTMALGWAGWRLVDQQSAIDEQRARDGAATTENIQLRCRMHNAYEARLFFRSDDYVVREASVPWPPCTITGRISTQAISLQDGPLMHSES